MTQPIEAANYQVKEGLYAALLPGIDFIGPVQEISKEGLAFRYISSGMERPRLGRLDLASETGRIFLKGIQCTVSKDIQIGGGARMPINLCRVKFLSTNSTQKDLLNILIQKYAII